MNKDIILLKNSWKEIVELKKERTVLQSRLYIAVHTLGIYADDRNWRKTPIFTEWILNPNASLLARDALSKIEKLDE